MPLEDQRLLELLLGLGVQQLLPEGDVREQGGERPAQLHGRLGAFLGGEVHASAGWTSFTFHYKDIQIQTQINEIKLNLIKFNGTKLTSL